VELYLQSAIRLHSVAFVYKRRIPFMVLCLVNYRDNFTFIIMIVCSWNVQLNIPRLFYVVVEYTRVIMTL
jgi:hypothetical protein